MRTKFYVELKKIQAYDDIKTSFYMLILKTSFISIGIDSKIVWKNSSKLPCKINKLTDYNVELVKTK